MHNSEVSTTQTSPEKSVQHNKTKKRCNSDSDLGAKKKPQNRLKNCPGLIVQRIKTLSKDNDGFFVQVVNEKALFLDELQAFKDFIDSYCKDDKTWKKIKQFLVLDLRFAKGLLELVYSFLSPKYLMEFEKWLKEGKMNINTKNTLKKEVQKILRKFQAMEEELGCSTLSIHSQKKVRLN